MLYYNELGCHKMHMSKNQHIFWTNFVDIKLQSLFWKIMRKFYNDKMLWHPILQCEAIEILNFKGDNFVSYFIMIFMYFWLKFWYNHGQIYSQQHPKTAAVHCGYSSYVDYSTEQSVAVPSGCTRRVLSVCADDSSAQMDGQQKENQKIIFSIDTYGYQLCCGGNSTYISNQYAHWQSRGCHTKQDGDSGENWAGTKKNQSRIWNWPTQGNQSEWFDFIHHESDSGNS